MLVLAVGPSRSEDGDASRGERVFQYCYACHSVQPGETGLQGPNLHEVVGRRIATQESFVYSPAMRAFAQREDRWSEALLDRYLKSPGKVVPKTGMAFAGVVDDQERADLIAYLRGTASRP